MARLGLQLYTVRDDAQRDFLGTIHRVAQMGYEGVEFAGGVMQAATAPELRLTLDETGLVAAGITLTTDDLNKDLTGAVRYCQAINCPVAVFPWIDQAWRTRDGFVAVAQKLNGAGEQLAGAGIRLLYHVHGYEFEDVGGHTAMDLLMATFDPRFVNLETDVYWVEHAGVDAVQFMQRYGDRSPYIHFKDFRDRETKHDVEVGEGAIDMPAIARLGHRFGAEWFIVEQEQFDMPPMESAAISYRNMRRIMQAA
jgi:sugar phosphate isomerase/epimerase